MGSVHGSSRCPCELWRGKHNDLIKLPMIPFRFEVMAHIPLNRDLRLWNPKTIREVIRRTQKVLGHEPQPLTQPEYDMTGVDDVTMRSEAMGTTVVSEDINENQYLVGTSHRG